MADGNQARRAPETGEREISVDLNAADPAKAVTRRNSADIARDVRDNADTDTGTRGRTKLEKDMFKRMSRLERNLERQFDQRLAAREAEHQRELSAMKERLDKVAVDRSGDDAADQAHETAIAALKQQLEAAYEKGDSKASADITLQISKLDAQFWAKKANAAGVVQREKPADGTQQQQPPARTSKTGPTIAGSRFIRANEDWWEDPEYVAENAACNAFYIELVTKEGFDPKSDETYKEIAKRMKEKFPDLGVKAGRRDPDEDDDDDEGARDTDTETRQRQRRAPAQRLDDRGGDADSLRNRGTNRTLTKQEIETMKACRLDPDNDKDVVTFLREAVALERAQA